MTLTERIESLVYLGTVLEHPSEIMKAVMQRAEIENAWFTQESIQKAIRGVGMWLKPDELHSWINKYKIADRMPERTGMILAGNIPMVGFHDVMTNYLAGNVSVIRFSEKDNVLIPYMLRIISEAFPGAEMYFDYKEDFKTIDRLVATGSDSAAGLFRNYFSYVPALIRCHRNAVAVITGDETDEELLALGEDAFSYFGLGCRNVSKLYVPSGYVFDRLLELWHDRYKEMVLHSKYKNNFDYLYAVYLLNKEPFLANGHVIIRESEGLSSPVASLFFEYYDKISDVAAKLAALKDKLQVVISKIPLHEFNSVIPGEAQYPAIDDYADGVDTMEFLLNN